MRGIDTVDCIVRHNRPDLDQETVRRFLESLQRTLLEIAGLEAID
ncbi:hypothetical protein ACFQ9X_23220 [Catenulispora yoronensis]